VLAAHALVGKGDNNPHTVDDAGNPQLIEATKAAGVKHFVFMSVLGAGPDAPVEFFRIKYQTEEYIRASGLSFTIIRPNAFMDLWAQLIGQPILDQGKTIIIILLVARFALALAVLHLPGEVASLVYQCLSHTTINSVAAWQA
jgi:uncharacterized protein YbjT (DUF2867 family)